MSRIGWTQPLCATCYVAWEIGRGRVPREPSRIGGDPNEDGDPCLICGQATLIYVRIDPEIAVYFRYAKVRDD